MKRTPLFPRHVTLKRVDSLTILIIITFCFPHTHVTCRYDFHFSTSLQLAPPRLIVIMIFTIDYLMSLRRRMRLTHPCATSFSMPRRYEADDKLVLPSLDTIARMTFSLIECQHYYLFIIIFHWRWLLMSVCSHLSTRHWSFVCRHDATCFSCSCCLAYGYEFHYFELSLYIAFVVINFVTRSYCFHATASLLQHKDCHFDMAVSLL